MDKMRGFPCPDKDCVEKNRGHCHRYRYAQHLVHKPVAFRGSKFHHRVPINYFVGVATAWGLAFAPPNTCKRSRPLMCPRSGCASAAQIRKGLSPSEAGLFIPFRHTVKPLIDADITSDSLASCSYQGQRGCISLSF